MLDDITMQRLILIKYLHTSAEEESRKNAPFGLTSILGLHDNVELFLDLACEHLGVPDKAGEFKHYWKLLEQKLSGVSLSQKRSMERLNNARAAFKHHGTLPSAFDIEKFRANTADFFEDNTPTIFGIEYNDVSLNSLIQEGRIKSLLNEADALLKQNSRQQAIEKIAIAFAQLLLDTRQTKFGWNHQSLFFLDPPHQRLPSNENLNKRFVNYVEDLGKAIGNLHEAMSIFTLGFDYQKYVKFKLWTPLTVIYTGQAEYSVINPSKPNDGVEGPSPEICRFCYDFVVDCAIRLQNLDFEARRKLQ